LRLAPALPAPEREDYGARPPAALGVLGVQPRRLASRGGGAPRRLRWCGLVQVVYR